PADPWLLRVAEASTVSLVARFGRARALRGSVVRRGCPPPRPAIRRSSTRKSHANHAATRTHDHLTRDMVVGDACYSDQRSETSCRLPRIRVPFQTRRLTPPSCDTRHQNRWTPPSLCSPAPEATRACSREEPTSSCSFGPTSWIRN